MIKIKRLSGLTPQLKKTMQQLVLQLNPNSKGLRMAVLGKALADTNTFVASVFDQGTLIGFGVLHIFNTVQWKKAAIEDIVIDEAYRGKGLGKNLVEALLAHAKKLKVDEVFLTSRPSRVAANALYLKLGFVKKDTNFYALYKDAYKE